MRRLASVVLVAALAIMPTGAGADEKSRDFETSGDRGPLEIENARHGHGHNDPTAAGQNVLYHRVTFVDPWSNDLLALDREPGPFAWLAFLVEVRKPNGRRHVKIELVNVASDNSLWVAFARRNGTVKTFARAWRPDERTLQIELTPRQTLRRSYRWRVVSHYFDPDSQECGEGDPDVIDDEGCRDSTGWIRHKL
jgi:hypothetical protein